MLKATKHNVGMQARLLYQKSDWFEEAGNLLYVEVTAEIAG